MKIRCGYHQPSHHRALRIGQPGLELVKQIPGVEIDFIDRGSAGMGVHFGLLKKYYEESLWLGRGLFKKLGNPSVRFGLTESHYTALQMSHGSGKPTLHPIQVLAAAYGLGIAKPKDFAYEPMDIPEPDLHQEKETVEEGNAHTEEERERKKTVALRH